MQLLERDLKGADQSFITVLENVNRFGAMKRLIFELQFAKEMKLPIVMQLINGWKLSTTPLSNKIINQNVKKSLPSDEGIKLLIGKSSVMKGVKELVKNMLN